MKDWKCDVDENFDISIRYFSYLEYTSSLLHNKQLNKNKTICFRLLCLVQLKKKMVCNLKYKKQNLKIQDTTYVATCGTEFLLVIR